jgi:hypothetical protein
MFNGRGTVIRPPKLDEAHVTEFCRRVSPGAAAILVECKPQLGKPMRECFTIVQEVVAAEGGTSVPGWVVWEWPGVFIEAEYRCVWRRPAGELLDLTPRPTPNTAIVFVPAPNRPYCGKQVDNIRQALIQDKDLRRYLWLFERQFAILNRGERAFEHGAIQLSNPEMKEMRNIQKEIARLESRLQRRYPVES